MKSSFISRAIGRLPGLIFKIRPSMIYDTIKRQAIQSVPFAQLAGVQAVSVDDSHGAATLPQRQDLLNHVGTVHAAALFALGEAASGLAMAGSFAPVITSVRPVASQARIRYLKPAAGTISARAHTVQPAAQLMTQLEAEKKVKFDVNVSLSNQAGDTVAEMLVEWHLRLKT